MAKNFAGFYNAGSPYSVSNKFVTRDSTATPVTSPVNVAGTGGPIVTLTCPDNAVELIIGTSASLRISDKSDMSSYVVLGTEWALTLPVATMDYVYLLGDSTASVVQFVFKCL